MNVLEWAAAAAPTVEQRLANLEAYVTNSAPDANGGALASVAGPGHNGWMMTSTALVLFMTLPGLALFYGGLARSKSVLSVLMQVFVLFSLITILWCIYGFSLAFTGDGPYIGTFEKLFLSGMSKDTLSGALPTIPDYVFVAFQSTFAAITCGLIVVT